jgi:hypothetical protein
VVIGFTTWTSDEPSHVNEAVVLHAGSGWTSVLFPIFPGDLTALSGKRYGGRRRAWSV